MLLTFSVPKPVNADFGGILMSPIISFITAIADVGQYLLEWAILGRPNYFMDQTIDSAPTSNSSPQIVVDKKLDGAFFGLSKVNVPDIQYTPEEIFANKVPGLDVNFIKPSVTTGDQKTDEKHNIALQLRPIIASWYVAIRILALVGLLSVLVYLGIRMLLTSVAADKAKYKKMLMDWIVAMCLLFFLHYIMSFALTMSEAVISMINSNNNNTITVSFTQLGKVYDMTLMNYVRFMIQCTDFKEKIAFCALYVMLMIFSIKFTWVYLKRVVNMAFLTLIAPIITVTYPIDKVSDGKAQAFGLWIKEFAFNALLQPLHLFLYTVLLGAAVQLALENPLYAVVCLGFITAAEKLFKKMFGFDKASGGTLGSLAAAAGLTGVANKAIMAMRKPKGGVPGKVRTNDKYQRTGKDPGANKGYRSFDKEGNKGLDQLEDTKEQKGKSDKQGDRGEEAQLQNGGNEGEVPPPNVGDQGEIPLPNGDNEGETLSPNGDDEAIVFAGQEEMDTLGREIDELEENGDVWSDPELAEQMRQKQKRYAELEAEKNAQQQPTPQGSPRVRDVLENLGPETQKQEEEEEAPKFFATVGNDFKNFGGRVGNKLGQAKSFGGRLKDRDSRQELFERGKKKVINGVRRNAVAAWKAAPTAGLNALKTVGRGVGAVTVGAVAGVAGAALTGDAEQSLGMALAGMAGGNAISGKVLNGTVGKINHNKTTRDAFAAEKYGSVIDARNAKADKAYLKSQEHNEEYEKYFKDGKYAMSKEEFTKATREYRKVGITDTKTIRKALHLEAQYAKDNKDAKEVRGKVQNIVQSYDAIDRKAIYGSDDKATEATLKNIENQLEIGDAKQKRAVANEILQGYRDWYNTP